MPLIRPNTCRGCGYAQIARGVPAGAPDHECHRHPPTVNVIGIQTPQGIQMMPNVTFVPVMAEWWCGEWKPKIAVGVGAGAQNGIGIAQ